MSIDLQGYLINWRADLEKAAERKRVQGMEAHQEAETIEADIADLDRAIAALAPATIVNTDEGWELEHSPAELFEVEKSEAREQLEREPEIPEEGTGYDLLGVDYGDDDTPAEHISILTGDPAIEPESGLHGGAIVARQSYMDGDQLIVHEIAASEFLVPPLENVTPEPGGYAPVTSPTIDDLIPEAMRQELEAEQRYAQPTNPDADERAKLNDWYDPKAVHERNRFNPWGIFKREPEEVS